MFDPYDEEEMETMTEEERADAEWINVEWLGWIEELEEMRNNDESPSTIYSNIMMGVSAHTDRADKWCKEHGIPTMTEILSSCKDAEEKDHNM